MLETRSELVGTIDSLITKISDAGLLHDVIKLCSVIEDIHLNYKLCNIDIPASEEYDRVAANGKFKLSKDSSCHGYNFNEIQDFGATDYQHIFLDNHDFMHYFLNKKIIVLEERGRST